jgi:hypothetical protein
MQNECPKCHEVCRGKKMNSGGSQRVLAGQHVRLLLGDETMTGEEEGTAFQAEAHRRRGARWDRWAVGHLRDGWMGWTVGTRRRGGPGLKTAVTCLNLAVLNSISPNPQTTGWQQMTGRTENKMQAEKNCLVPH